MELDLSGLQVYGECQASLFQQVTETIRSGTFEVIFVEGEGGSGKTTLFQACCEYLDTKNHEFPIVYARDKWEEHFYCHSTHAASFWRILNCLRQVLVKLESIEPPLESEGSERSFQTQLRAEFAAELNILSTIVPLKVKSQPNDDLAPLALSTDRTGGLDRVRLAVRDLLRFITLHAKVVWFLDDLQWVDESSLQLIQTILFDKELSNFVLVGTHRPLYSDSGSLSECPIDQVPHLIDRLKTAIRVADPSSECARATLLRVRNLEMLDVTHLLCDLFQRPRDEIDAMQPLAAAVHKKTNGNAFFVIQFVQLLVTLSLIKFSFVEYRWVWDLQAIYAETDVSENVVQIVTAKLRAMTAELRHVLSTAAFLGMNQIQFDLLQYILASSKIVTENDDLQNITAGLSNENNEATGTVVRFNADMLERLLQQGVAEGILEKLDHSDREYKFAHDRIKESALLLLPPDKVTQRRLHLHVSKRLRKRLLKMTKSPKDSIDTRSMERKDTLLLLTVSHINAGSEQIQKPADRLVAASLNLEAGRLAAENASYYIARDFLSAGLKFLDISKGWNEYYDIKLELTTALARAHFCCGDFEKSRIYGERVVKNARSLEDKLLAYRSLVYYYIHNARLSVALDVVLNVLSKVGLEIPTRFQVIHFLRRLRHVKRKLESFPDEELVNLPAAPVNSKVNTLLTFLPMITEICIPSGDKKMQVLAQLELMNMSLHYGSTRLTAFSFASCGVMFCVLGDIKSALRYANIATTIAQAKRYPVDDSRAILVANALTLHWKYSYQTCLEPIVEVYETFQRLGAVELLFFTAYLYSVAYFCSGMKLEPILKDTMKTLETLNDYKQSYYVAILRPHLQLILNLCGLNSQPTILTGDAMDQDECIKSWTENSLNRALLASYMARLFLGCYFNDFELAHAMSSKLASIFADKSSLWLAPRLMFQGLAAFALAQKRNHRHKAFLYQREGLGYLRQVEALVKKGSVNAHYMLLLLRAEAMVCKRVRFDKTKEAFDCAVTAAGKLGLLQFQALANERAGVYLLAQAEENDGELYLTRARDLYREWGAEGKALHMEGMYTHISLFRSTKKRRHGTSIKARTRLDEIMTSRRRSSDSFPSFISRDSRSSGSGCLVPNTGSLLHNETRRRPSPQLTGRIVGSVVSP